MERCAWLLVNKATGGVDLFASKKRAIKFTQVEPDYKCDKVEEQTLSTLGKNSGNSVVWYLQKRIIFS